MTLVRKHITIQDILKQPKAQEAMSRLGLPARDYSAVADFLVSFPYLSDTPEPIHRNIKNRTIAQFPKRLRKMAAEIERINASPFVNPPTVLAEGEGLYSSPELEPLRTWRASGIQGEKAALFMAFPDLLREYAAYLQLLVRALQDRHFRRPTQVQLVCIKLIEIIENASGKPRYELLAELLTAALHAAGQYRTVEANQLKLLYNRNYWLVAVVRSTSTSERR